MEGQGKVLQRAKQHSATISQGMNVTVPKRRTTICVMPSQESKKLSPIQDEMGELSTVEGYEPNRAGQQSRDKANDLLPSRQSAEFSYD